MKIDQFWIRVLFVVTGLGCASKIALMCLPGPIETVQAQKVKVSEAIDVTGATNSTTGLGSIAMSSGTIITKAPDPFDSFRDVSLEEGCNGLRMEIYQTPPFNPSEGKGRWSPASCGDILTFLYASRDIRSVTLGSPRRDSPLRHVLYPQYRSWFTLTSEEWKLLQAKAAHNLKEDGSYAQADVVAHWKSIVAGKVPFGLQVEK